MVVCHFVFSDNNHDSKRGRISLMKQKSHIFRIAVMLLFAFGLFGCGQNSSSSGGNSLAKNSETPTTSLATLSPVPTISTTTDVPGNDQSRQVTLSLNAQQYSPDAPLLVTIHNGMQASIWVQNQRTGCTSITVERMIGGTWQPTGGCALTRPPQTIEITTGSAVTQRIDFAQGMDTGAGWPVGTYRVKLHYAMSKSTIPDAGVQVQSSVFTIG
jgi:hypothetical protein